MEFLNSPEPWSGATRGPTLGMVELIENGTVPVDAAAALWWAVERGASFFVVAGPGSAGKTTLANALLGFLPENAQLYAVDGSRDRIEVSRSDAPLYLLINELSDHMERYVQGAAALRAFALLRSGYRMIGTLHADSAAEALAVMQEDSGIPQSDAVRIPLILVLRPADPGSVAGWRLEPDAERRLVQIGVVAPAAPDPVVRDFAAWDPAAGRLVRRPAPGGVAALAAWSGTAPETAQDEIAIRATMLQQLVSSGRRAPAAIANLIRDQRRSGSVA